MNKFNKKNIIIAQRQSRGTEIDFTKCANNVGGNRFQLVILAAARARQILKTNARREMSELPAAPVTALLEIQQGKFTR
jgi:DNA-directed RNA polymerase omega subunit